MLRTISLLSMLLIAACGGGPRNRDHAAFVAQGNARLAEVRTAHGTFQARSELQGGAIRTVVTGDRRDEIGDAIAQIYAVLRDIDRAGGYGAEINAGREQPVLTWNGRTVRCTLQTVVFAP